MRPPTVTTVEKDAEEETCMLAASPSENRNGLFYASLESSKRATNGVESPPDVFTLYDDGESDIDNVPEAKLFDEPPISRQAKIKGFANRNDLVKFFQCSSYRILSFLLGPMICSWIIA